MGTQPDRDSVPLLTPDDAERIRKLLYEIGGQHVVWGAQQTLDVWMAEVRMKADREAAHRLTVATWVLAGMTLVLALATVGLIVATLAGG